ncbi:glycosyltransferase family 2 protein [Flavimarina sp. Hel_I_48]|uniref:glycosyltransferase family 2 protein n=1 Tax=Flavimarina sp. Hel_I_48 TaxID=1392488 RepID=UPI0004DF24C2|nr:glycosyltransferase family 2 protein [Flavimarina sp. Hel_I_48]
MVSIITPFFNAEKFLAESIESVLSQTYINWELLLIDDCSTDDSSVIAFSYAQMDARIKIITFTENKGAGIARNEGIKNASGNKIAFLDSDDRWKPQKLEVQLAFMERHSATVCYSSYALIKEDGTPLNIKIQALPILGYKKMLRANYIGNLTGIYDVQQLGKTFAPTLRKRQDWALWLDLVEKAGRAHGIQEVLAYYRVRKGSLSSIKWKMLRYNLDIYQKHLGYGFLKSHWFMLRFLGEQLLIKPLQTKKFKAKNKIV